MDSRLIEGLSLILVLVAPVAIVVMGIKLYLTGAI
jgi:hypothetical protein